MSDHQPIASAAAWGTAPGSCYWQTFLGTSIVIVSHDEGPNLRRTVHNFLVTAGANAEIIVVDDASADGSLDFLAVGYPSVRVIRSPTRLGVSRARNLGAQAAGGHVLVFSDAHVELPTDWHAPLVRALAEPYVGLVGPAVVDVWGRGMVGCGMTVADPDALELAWLPTNALAPTPVPALCGMFLAMRRDVFWGVGGFDPGMRQWGEEDLELSIRIWLLGLRVMGVPEVVIGHLFRDEFPYAVDTEALLANRVRLGLLHLDGPRLERYLRRLGRDPGYRGAVEHALAAGTEDARRRLRQIRRHDIEWYLRDVVRVEDT